MTIYRVKIILSEVAELASWSAIPRVVLHLPGGLRPDGRQRGQRLHLAHLHLPDQPPQPALLGQDGSSLPAYISLRSSYFASMLSIGCNYHAIFRNYLYFPWNKRRVAKGRGLGSMADWQCGPNQLDQNADAGTASPEECCRCADHHVTESARACTYFLS